MLLSVIVPAYNSEKTIARTLKSLLASSVPKRQYEIIVVDDGSRDDTVKVAKKFRGVKVYARKHAGPAVQRNYGAKMAKGKILFFTDSDCVAPKDLLKRVMINFEKEDIAGVGGVYKTLNNESFIARYIGYEIGYRHEKESKYTDFLGTYCCAYKRDIFLKFGGFDENFMTSSGEDPELSFRISREHRLVLDKKLFVWHPHPISLKKYLKTQFWRAYWRVLMYKKSPNKMLGESYTGLEIPLASFFISIAFLTALLGFFNSELFLVSALSLFLFYAVYFKLFSYLARKESGQIPFTLLLLPIRTVICIIGFLYGTVKLRKD